MQVVYKKERKYPEGMIILLFTVTMSGVLSYLQANLFSDMEKLHILVLLMLLDFVTGVTKSYCNEVPITSKGFRESIGKVVQYAAFLILTRIILGLPVNMAGEHTLMWLSSWSYYVLIFTEVVSVYENIVAINPKADFVRPVVKRLGRIIKIIKGSR